MRLKSILMPLLLLLLLGVCLTPVYSSKAEQIEVSGNISYVADNSDFTYISTGGVITGHKPGDTTVMVPSKDMSGKPVTEISNGVFNNDDYIETLIIPASVTSLGWLNLMNCNNLKVIILQAEDPITSWTSIFGAQLSSKVKIYVPDAAYDAYRKAGGWKIYKKQIYPISEM